MEWIIIVIAVIQMIGVSLGVGASTLAVLNFFAAIKDGIISPEERNLMGIVYIVLRVAMVSILISTALLAIHHIMDAPTVYFTDYRVAFWTIIVVLFANALLMTLHIMPNAFGPAIQASSWYTLGILQALLSLNVLRFHYWQFLVGYGVLFALATLIINGTLIYIKDHTPPKEVA